MKKSIKIILVVILLFAILITTYIILIVKGILLNPFLDTKDLVCSLENIYEYNGADNIFTFKFDKKAIIESYTETYVYYYDNADMAKKEYKKFTQNENTLVELNQNIIKVLYNQKIEKDKGYYGKSKKDIKKIYVKELSYKCE